MSFASKVFLVRSWRFGYNPQTAASNAFQAGSGLDADEVAKRALREFDAMAEGLANLGIDVVIGQDHTETHTPDAVFPNNWFSTHPDGTLFLYPMMAPARRRERDPELIELIKEAAHTRETVDLTGYEAEERYLEGTGSLVIDSDAGIVYACNSSRTDPELVEHWCGITGMTPVLFRAVGPKDLFIYHTNVLLCIAKGFAILCSDSIDGDEGRMAVVGSLEGSGKDVIEISREQMTDFAGNALQLVDSAGEPVLVMSSRARRSLESRQLARIEECTAIADFDIPTIEVCGGGSVRCMIAEIFERKDT